MTSIEPTHRQRVVGVLGACGLVLGCCLAAIAGPSAQAAVAPTGELEVGEVVTLTTSGNEPATLSFTAETPGFLTVVARGRGGDDLTLAVTDELGQVLPEGRVDQDISGDMGAEQLTVALTSAGDYRVRVDTRSSRSELRLASTWIPFPDAEAPADPDGKPTTAVRLEPGDRHQDSLDSSAGDHWDWFAIETAPGSVVMVLTEAPEGDLVMELFDASNFGEATERSDQDLNGVAGNESMTIQNTEGGTVYVRVTMLFSSGQAVPYTIRAGVM